MSALFDTSGLRDVADATPVSLGRLFAQTVSGWIGPCSFILTEDFDGQVEVSLSRGPAHSRPTEGNIRAFESRLRVALGEPTKTRTGYHWVLREGREQ